MPRKSTTRRGKYNRQTATAFPALHPDLLEVQSKLRNLRETGEQNEAIQKAICALKPFTAHSMQLECIRHLLFDTNDLVLVAKTSAGKSLITQMLPILVPDSTIIVVLPLLALGDEQVAKISGSLVDLGGAKPIFLCSKNNDEEMLQKIRQGSFTHIFLSPEILTGNAFRRVLNDSSFRRRVRWLAIDELHLVYLWGRRFRQSYSLINSVRSSLGSVPMFGCTSTLDTPTWIKAQEYARFKPQTRIIRTSIDRADIAFVRGVINRNDKGSYKDLCFDDSCASVDMFSDHLQQVSSR